MSKSKVKFTSLHTWSECKKSNGDTEYNKYDKDDCYQRSLKQKMFLERTAVRTTLASFAMSLYKERGRVTRTVAARMMKGLLESAVEDKSSDATSLLETDIAP